MYIRSYDDTNAKSNGLFYQLSILTPYGAYIPALHSYCCATCARTLHLHINVTKTFVEMVIIWMHVSDDWGAVRRGRLLAFSKRDRGGFVLKDRLSLRSRMLAGRSNETNMSRRLPNIGSCLLLRLSHDRRFVLTTSDANGNSYDVDLVCPEATAIKTRRGPYADYSDTNTQYTWTLRHGQTHVSVCVCLSMYIRQRLQKSMHKGIMCIIMVYSRENG